MTRIYCDKRNDWGIERDENNNLFYYFFDPGMVGEKVKVEIGEDELNFALNENPDRDEMAMYIAANKNKRG